MSKKKFFNWPQREFMMVSALNNYIVASRGLGKSEGFDAPWLLRNVFAMPRSSGAILSPTYGKLLRNTLPAMFHGLARLGYHRNIHYFVGRRPPKHFNFKKPYIDPFDYSYVIIWFNGSVNHLISFDRPMSANSMSLDYIMGPEAKYLNYDKVKSEVGPANRGNSQYFGDCPYHHGQLFTTDMPTRKSGYWILDKEKEMDGALVNLIKTDYQLIKAYETDPNSQSGKQMMDVYQAMDDNNFKDKLMYALKANPQSLYSGRKIRSLRKELTLFRGKTTFYAEYSAIENIELLGEDFLARMKRDLPPIMFQTAILNKRISKIEGGFYSSLNDKVHCYTASNHHYLESLDYDLNKAAYETCKKDNDIDYDQSLKISFDYNANINWLMVGQVTPTEIRTIKSFYVKHDRKLRELVRMFVQYYKPFSLRRVVFYYNNTALNTNYAVGEGDFKDVVIEELDKAGWDVTPVYMGKQMSHKEKHLVINQALKGQKYLFPTFNSDNNEELLPSMEATGIRIGKHGFEKDKSGEKYPDSADDPLELRTDGTDAWDDLFIGCNFFPHDDTTSVPMGTNYG